MQISKRENYDFHLANSVKYIGSCFKIAYKISVYGQESLNCLGSIPGMGKKCFSALQRPHRLWSSQPGNTMDSEDNSKGVDVPRRGAEDSPPSNNDVMKVGSVTPFLHTSSRYGVYLIESC
jgi:hypothetical protein